MIEKCFRGSVVIVLVFHQNNQGSNPTYPPSKQFFVFLRFFRLESNISPYFSPFHAKFFQRGHEVNSRRRSSIEEKEKRSVFRGIIDEQRGGEVERMVEKRRGSIRNRISRHVLSISDISWNRRRRGPEDDDISLSVRFDER